MKHLLLFLMAILVEIAPSNAQTYKWVKGGGTNMSLSSEPNVEAAYFMCADIHGNIYSLSVVGNNAITADTFYRSSAFGSAQNVLFTSHNCNGQMRFAKLISAYEAVPQGVLADNSGHIYLALDLPHYFTMSGSANLRIGYDTTITTHTNNHQTLIQYDTVGHLNWLRYAEYAPSTFANSGGTHNFIALDGANNIHMVCKTGYGCPLSPSVTSHSGYYDLKYDALGNLLTINQLQIDSSLWVDGMTIDKQSNKMYAYGMRNFYSFPDSSRYSYITALDGIRNRIWIDTLTNPYFPLSKNFGAIIADGSGHLYMTIGAPGGLVYRGDTAINAISGGSTVAVVMKTDTAGEPIWMRIFSGTLSVNGLIGLTLMGINKIAASGGMVGTVACGAHSTTSYTGEGQSAYFTILDTAGYVHSIQQIHGSGFYDWANKIVASSNGNLYIGGKVENNVWAGTLAPYTSVGGDSDYFIMKYGVDCSCTSMPESNYTYSGSIDLTRSFTYTGTSTGIDSVKWTFGDGATSTSMTPVHTYTGSGTFTTCVRVYSSCGEDMRCREITVSCASSPISAFTDTGVLVHGFTYTGTTAGIDSVVWNFGDGFKGAGLTAMHTYAVADTYRVCAKVFTNCGVDSFCKEVYINVPGLVSVARLSEIVIFPNPATDELYVNGIDQKIQYRLVDLVGGLIEAGTFIRGTNILQTLQLPSGMYLLEMSVADGSKRVVRIMKQ
jgi:PKD repeat protein